ncbi:hypothetical protein [Streptomyces rubiginosohelvolus]|uniref:hypothetical protein n=1 Tax=Streptomyces rubiginosohelvolus TaxID=67362 RepID=UPI0033A9E1A5
MATYQMTNGHTIRTRVYADGVVDFETTNVDGEVISNVHRCGREARDLVDALEVHKLLSALLAK